MAQRIVRAKSRIRNTGIPYRVPPVDELPERLDGVLAVLYLVFTEGYSATSGESVLRVDLAAEGIRLTRLTVELLAPADQDEARALLALMLLQHSRRDARSDGSGELVPFEDQDRDSLGSGLDRRSEGAAPRPAPPAGRVPGAGRDRPRPRRAPASVSHGLAGDRGPLPRTGRARRRRPSSTSTSRSRGASPRDRGRASPHSTASRRRARSRGTTCCRPPKPICCGETDSRMPPPGGTAKRWRSHPPARNVVTSSGELARGGAVAAA